MNNETEGLDKIQSYFLFNVMMGKESDTELKEICKELDNVDNLNSNPMAIRTAGYKAMRRAFVLGVQSAAKIK